MHQKWIAKRLALSNNKNDKMEVKTVIAIMLGGLKGLERHHKINISDFIVG